MTSALGTGLLVAALTAPAASASPSTQPAPSSGSTAGTTSSTAGDARSRTKLFGMPAPVSAQAATSDDAMLAWAIKHGSATERRNIAGSIGVTYPAAAAVLGRTCDKGQGYVGVWVVNFKKSQTQWTVTLDGAAYAVAQVRPASHDYGALGVPDGRHTVAIVDSVTGAVAARTVTNLHCGSTSGTDSGWSTTQPGHGNPTTTSPSPRPSRPTTPATTPGVGPVVETDHVSGTGGSDMRAAALALVAAGGVLLAATRRLRRR